MFFGVAFRWYLLPILAMLFMAWVLYHVFRAMVWLAVILARLLAPVAAAALVAWLGRLDARFADRLETAEDRRANGRERMQERAARADLYGRRLAR